MSDLYPPDRPVTWDRRGRVRVRRAHRFFWLPYVGMSHGRAGMHWLYWYVSVVVR